MIAWAEFVFFASAATVLWFAGAVAAWKDRRGLALGLTMAGLCVYIAFIIGLWAGLQRPPMLHSGGNPSVVFALHGGIRSGGICTLEIQVDNAVFGSTGHGVRMPQCVHASDS